MNTLLFSPPPRAKSLNENLKHLVAAALYAVQLSIAYDLWTYLF